MPPTQSSGLLAPASGLRVSSSCRLLVSSSSRRCGRSTRWTSDFITWIISLNYNGFKSKSTTITTTMACWCQMMTVIFHFEFILLCSCRAMITVWNVRYHNIDVTERQSMCGRVMPLVISWLSRNQLHGMSKSKLQYSRAPVSAGLWALETVFLV